MLVLVLESRYIGKVGGHGLYPEDAKVAALVDALIDQEKDFGAGIQMVKYGHRHGLSEEVFPAEAKEKARAANVC